MSLEPGAERPTIVPRPLCDGAAGQLFTVSNARSGRPEKSGLVPLRGSRSARGRAKQRCWWVNPLHALSAVSVRQPMIEGFFHIVEGAGIFHHRWPGSATFSRHSIDLMLRLEE